MHPELGYQEVRTAGRVAERLRAAGYSVRTGVGRTGVIGVRQPEHGAPTRGLLIRADMDALPITESNDVEYRSAVDGVMHACGHDGHVAIALAIAERLARTELPGTVKMVFQPAEEGGAGAAAMIADGALQEPTVDGAIGIHLWSDLPTGTVAIAPGPVFASVDNVEIVVRGRGGHAASPHQTVDPIVVAAHLITSLQTVVSRRCDPGYPAVFSITQIRAGTTHNVIPDEATLVGTVRTYGGKFYEQAPRLIEELTHGTVRAFGAEAEVRYDRAYPPTVNDHAMADLMADIASDLLGEQHVICDYRTMAAEDMAFFLEQVPGCYAFVGCRNAERGANHPHHSPRFNVDEHALPLAVELLSQTAVRFLQRPEV
jgi:amidohydrolase